MASMIEVVKQFFEEEDWRFVELEEHLLRTGFQGNNGRWSVYVQTYEEHDILLSYCICPVNCPEDRRLEMSSFFTRANYGMRLGNFEMDFADGELRFKVSLDVEGEALTVNLVRNAIVVNCRTADRYLPGMMALIYGGADAEQAIAIVEGDDDGPAH
ncbi:MAG: YbjN domain-containing protein [Alphaproteobacteria bacterium]|nr:YbjN domain-containing protein [Alphaproteobacteria bacterium]